MQERNPWIDFAVANPAYAMLMATCTLYTGFGVIVALFDHLGIAGQPPGTVAKTIWAVAFGGLMILNARRLRARAGTSGDEG